MAWSISCNIPQMTFHRWLLILALLATAWMLGSLLSAMGIYMFINTQEYTSHHRQHPGHIGISIPKPLYQPWEAKTCLYFGMAINLLSMLVMVLMILYEKRAIIQRIKPDHPPSYKEVMRKAETPPPTYNEIQVDGQLRISYLDDEDNMSLIDDISTIDNNSAIENRSIIDNRNDIDSRNFIDNENAIDNRSIIYNRILINNRSSTDNRSIINDNEYTIDNRGNINNSSGISSMQITNDTTNSNVQPNRMANNIYQGMVPIHRNKTPPPPYTAIHISQITEEV